MASMDVGDAVTVTFTTTPGATVVVSWIGPNGLTAIDRAAVVESPAASGKYPSTYVVNAPGVWQVLYTASGTATQVERFYVRANALTGPPPLATAGEVAEQFGALSPTQEALTATLLRGASKLVRSRFPRIDAQIAKGVLDPDVVALAVVGMVLRVLRNPQGLRSETVGPFSRAYDTSAAAGLLVITADDESMFKPNAARLSRARTIMARPGLAPWPHGARPWMSNG